MARRAPSIPYASGLLPVAEVCRRTGWTRALVRRLLGEPDETRPNPWYRTAPPLLLYRHERVVAVEQTDEFRAEREGVEKRREAAAKGVETKRRRMLEYVENLVVEIPVYEPDELVRRACDSYNRYWGARWRDGMEWKSASPDDGAAFLDRITVNYLLHVKGGYNRELRRLGERTGFDVARPVLRGRVLDAIAAAYPHLRDECERHRARE